MAPIMFFNGMCQTPEGPLEGVENPYLLDNLAFNFQMKLKAEAYYPGLTLRTFLKAYRAAARLIQQRALRRILTCFLVSECIITAVVPDYNRFFWRNQYQI